MPLTMLFYNVKNNNEFYFIIVMILQSYYHLTIYTFKINDLYFRYYQQLGFVSSLFSTLDGVWVDVESVNDDVGTWNDICWSFSDDDSEVNI